MSDDCICYGKHTMYIYSHQRELLERLGYVFDGSRPTSRCGTEVMGMYLVRYRCDRSAKMLTIQDLCSTGFPTTLAEADEVLEAARLALLP